MKVKHTLLLLIALCLTLTAQAQMPPSPLHVDGSSLRDIHGNRVVLHGVMDTPSPYFNNGRWGTVASMTTYSKCIDYFNNIYTMINNPVKGTHCNVFRLHLDPAWCFVNGTSEADYGAFNMSNFKKYWTRLYRPLILNAMGHGLYVVVRPPGVCPDPIKVDDDYQAYLKQVWDYVSSDDSIKHYAGYISLELANEPVNIQNASGSATTNAPHDFFQPIVDQIRANGFTGIIWVPGAGYQSIYTGYASYPITGYNIGYAVHDYPGWYSGSDTSCDPSTYIQNFTKMVPVAETNPIIITECDWSPEVTGKGHTNEHGDYVPANLGTWGTAATSKWGKAFKALIDKYGASMTLSSTGAYIDIDKALAGTYEPAYTDSAAKAGVSVAEACSKACWDWYASYATENYARPEFSKTYTADQGDGTFINPILNADFPDPDVIRVGDTYYMSTTTMYQLPGVTIMKSKDLVNWEYCCNPMESLGNDDSWNLKNGKNRYAQGAWASWLRYHNGTYYLGFLSFGDGGGYYVLTATDPEGKWTVKKLNDGYYDSSLLFDGDDMYMVSGINTLTVTKLDQDFNKVSSKEVISRPDAGLEGSHFYKIGNYYYIYSTYGGTEGSQTIFRSTSPMGTYEEVSDRLMKDQHIHQGSLVETQTGEWWTILFKDDGAIGRVPYLEPVTWSNGWPTIGNAGVDVSKGGTAYAKPNVGATYPTTTLPTNDTFTGTSLGMQWQWSHNPDNAAWSLLDNPGWLRLRTTGIADNLKQARNTLTQRIVGLSHVGESSTNQSYGTIKMDVSNMQDGDIAGLSVFQDPYAYIAVKQDGSQRSLVIYHAPWDGSGELSKTIVSNLTSNVVYLQARCNFKTSKARFYYSTDGTDFTPAGNTYFSMMYHVTTFVGQRFDIFNYATKANGGYVDVDWFSTEPTFEETTYYSPELLTTFTAADLTASYLDGVDDVTLLNGSNSNLTVTAVMQSGLRRDVSAQCTYSLEGTSDVISLSGTTITALKDGTAAINLSYTDPQGNTITETINITVETFPLTTSTVNTALNGSNNFTESTKTFTLGNYGFAGWRYDHAVNFSTAKYLVIDLEEKPSNLQFRIYSTSTYDQSAGYSRALSAAHTRISLSAIAQAKADIKNVLMAGFLSTKANNTFKVKSVFLSNDGTTPTTGINLLDNDEPAVATEYYGLDGTRRSQLMRGVNIVKETLADGSIRSRKVIVK